MNSIRRLSILKQPTRFIILLFFAGILSGCATVSDFVANQFFLPNEGIREGAYSVWTERRVGFTTSEGISLLADVHHPMGLEKTPTILVRIPYTNTFSNRSRSDVIGRYWASRGYTVVIQGTRGRYESGGQFYPLVHERRDGLETLQWLENQSWYDGRLAMWGGSAFGHTQWAIADQSAPDALFVHIASTNFHKMFYPGDAFSLESALYWAIRSRGREDRAVDIAKLEQGLQTLPIIAADDVAIGDTDFYNDWVLNKNDGKFWAKIDGINRAKTLQAPVLLMAGWFDPFLPTQIEDFKIITTQAKGKVASETRLIIGPWGHALSLNLPGAVTGYPYRQASIAPSIPWFDYQLGLTKQPLDLPRVRLFVMGTNEWRDENEWPLARAEYTPFYIRNNGQLNEVLPGKEEESDHYVYNPQNPVPSAGGAMLGTRAGIQIQNEIEKRDDVMVYSTDPLSKPVEVTGPVRAILYVSTDAASTDFTAKLVDVHPDGTAYNLSDGIVRRSYNASNNEPTKIEIELWPTSNIFLEGHKIRLEISSSNFPRYDRNLNTGEDEPTATKMVPANQTVFHSAEYPSRVILPIIP